MFQSLFNVFSLYSSYQKHINKHTLINIGGICIVNTIIIQPTISKRQQKRERKAQMERELKQLSNIGLISAKPVNIPETIPIKHVSKAQEEKEQKMRKWMDTNYLNMLCNPDSKKYKSKGLGNSPRSTWDRLQTEHRVSMDKYTCSNMTDYEKKNKYYKFAHNGENMPVKRIPLTHGISKSKAPTKEYIEEINIREFTGIIEEKTDFHGELK